jgi:hypothetical protein
MMINLSLTVSPWYWSMTIGKFPLDEEEEEVDEPDEPEDEVREPDMFRDGPVSHVERAEPDEPTSGFRRAPM